MNPRRTRTRARRTTAILVSALVATGGGAALASTLTAGPRADGTAVTPLGTTVTPVGDHTTLGDLPLGSALSPDGSLMLVSNNGQGTQSLQVVETRTRKVVQTIKYTTPQGLFIGVAFSPDGTRAYASGGGQGVIHTYDVRAGRLTETAPVVLPTTNPSGVKVTLFPAGLAVTPDGERLVVADHLADAVSVVDLATGAVSTTPVGPKPKDVQLSSDGRTAWVSNQGDRTVTELAVDGTAATVTRTVRVGTHPGDLLLSRDSTRLYVADGDSDAVSVVDPRRGRVVRTISLAPYRGAKVGSAPFGLAESGDGSTLYVSTAGNNAVAVVDTRSGEVRGRIPTGWYPTGLQVAGGTLLVLNAKGLGAGPNDGPGHPDPTSPTKVPEDQYIGSMIAGTLSAVDTRLSRRRLARYTAQVASNEGFDKPQTTEREPAIKHVIYVVQENRTYDQVMGSLGRGNGDPSLNLFGDESAPNQRALQKRFVTLDNFYANAEISAQGWNWSVAANSNPYAEAMWPANYSGRHGLYPSETDDRAVVPNRSLREGYIWQRLQAAGVSFRNYGFYVQPDKADPTYMRGTDGVLDRHTDHAYHGYDLACPDNPDTFRPLKATCGTPRFTEWRREFDRFVKNGDLPDVQLLRLPNDHTSGTKPGAPTPRAYVADNDLMLGRVVDAVSHSPYWKDTAIFVTEDDAQNGPDHVDAHRTISQVISPYSQHGSIDSTFYSTASMLRTIENIAGVAPLSQFDTFATPMVASFEQGRKMRRYRARRPLEAGDTRNPASAPLASLSARQQLGKEDMIDERDFNRAIWKSVRGARSVMPEPRHTLPGASGSPAPDSDD